MEKPIQQKKRNYLILQGPIGSFFNDLSTELENLGHNTLKINFWGGDYVFYRNAISFDKKIEEWNSFLLRTCNKNKITDIILFGDRRIYHEKAIETIANAKLNIRIWVFEEGYYRPHWITMDKYGSNYRSSISLELKNQHSIHTENDSIISIKPWIKDAVPTIATYYAVGLLSQFKFPHFIYHRLQHPLVEMSGWILKWLGTQLGFINPERNFIKSQKYLGNHYLAALQLETDAQIRKYSPFKNMNEFMDVIIKSFAENANKDKHLFIKDHPYNEKWIKRENECNMIAQKYKVADRVHFIDGCPLNKVLDNCDGLITINSTLGLIALDHNIKVKALGQTFWDIKDITYSNNIDTFWNSSFSPNLTLVKSLKRVIKNNTQYNGNFYSSEGKYLAIKNIITDLTEGEQDLINLQKKVIERKTNNSVNKQTEKIKRLDMRV